MVFIDPERFGAITQGEGQRKAIPKDWKKHITRPFAGLNLAASRFDINDGEFYWMENFIRIGDGKLQTVYDIDPAGIYTTGTTGKVIASFQFYTLNGIDYFIAFHTDGTANWVQVSNGMFGNVSNVLNTFIHSDNPNRLPAVSMWGTQYLLISNNNTQDDYWLWDSSLLFTAGSVAPNPPLISGGQGYTKPPTVTAFGGSGSGAQFQAVVDRGSVVAVQVTNPGHGYSFKDVQSVQLAFSDGGIPDRSAQLRANLSTGQAVIGIQVINQGKGYEDNPDVTITGGGGTTPPTTLAILQFPVSTGHGSPVASISLLTPGTDDFTTTPTVTITPHAAGPGAGATAVAIMSGGAVHSVNVIDGGAGYQGTPQLTFVGGGGFGASGVAELGAGGQIADVVMQTRGQQYTSPPTVVVEPTNNAAASGIIPMMPFGISGSALESYLGRVVLTNPHTRPGLPSNGGTRLISAPGSFTDFATSDGGVISPTNESALLKSYVALGISGGYLYFFGDTSISVMSSITTSGSPTTTSFNYQTLDTQSGTIWRDSVQSVGRDLIFANPTGVYRLEGGTPTKLSQNIDPLFTTAPGTVITFPSAAVTTFFSHRLYLLNFRIIDPRTGKARTVLLAIDEGRWQIISQSVEFTYIATYQKGAEPQAYGTDGTSVWPLMALPSSGITKNLVTKLWDADKYEMREWIRALFIQASSNDPGGLMHFNLRAETEQASYPLVDISTVDNSLTFTIRNPLPVAELLPAQANNVFGREVGMSLTTTNADMELYDFAIAFSDEGMEPGEM